MRRMKHNKFKMIMKNQWNQRKSKMGKWKESNKTTVTVILKEEDLQHNHINLLKSDRSIITIKQKYL